MNDYETLRAQFQTQTSVQPPPVLLPPTEARVLAILNQRGREPSAMDSSPELQQLLEQEKEKMMMNEIVGKLTNECWDKCITATPESKFRSGETTCLSNCAQRFLDMSMIIAQRFETH